MRFVLALIATLLITLAIPTAHAETRIALVIGNGAYKNLRALANPPNDARDLADALRRLDFEVDLGVDLTLNDMQHKVTAFARRAQTADVALAFYAGHGVQAPDVLGGANPVNYLLPIDADIKDAADLDFLPTARDIVARLQAASGVRILILDACRDNPITQRLGRGRGASVARGLSPEPKTNGTLIAYSTQPGTIADDGDDRNSPFVRALLDHIAEPGLDIRLLFADVRRDVIRRSNGAQTPETSDSLDGRFVFKKGEPGAAMANLSPPPVNPARPVTTVPVTPEAGTSRRVPRWVKYCGKDNDAHDVCFTGQDGRTEAAQPAAAAALIEPAGGSAGKKLFRVSVPTPLQIQFGTRLIIDQDAPLSGSIVACDATGCIADYEATPALIDRLTKGRTLQIQAIKLDASTVSFTMPLTGQTGVTFRSAYVGSPADPYVSGLLRDKIFLEPPAADTIVPPGQALVYSAWAKFCGKGQQAGAKEVCFTGKDARTEAGRPIAAAALIEPTGEPKKLFRITLPSPIQLQYGARLVLDREQPLSGAFFTCFAKGCMADWEATPDLIGKLKRGQTLQLQFINLNGTTVSYPLPLSDQSGNSFRSANEGPPTDPAVFEAQKKKLEEDLRRRAEQLKR